jgi:hypothetical protein
VHITCSNTSVGFHTSNTSNHTINYQDIEEQEKEMYREDEEDVTQERMVRKMTASRIRKK